MCTVSLEAFIFLYNALSFQIISNVLEKLSNLAYTYGYTPKLSSPEMLT